MDNVNRAQVRAARALLDWAQPELADAAGISLATVKKFETGERRPIPIIKAAIVRALQDKGIEFVIDGRRAGVFLDIQKLSETNHPTKVVGEKGQTPPSKEIGRASKHKRPPKRK